MKTVGCQQCSSELETNCLDASGEDRAVICRGGQLHGEYGSIHDMSVVEILDGEFPEGATFCDAFVDNMLAQGKLREIGTVDSL